MINVKDKSYYSIFEVNDYIKVLFDNTITLQNIGLFGEISNFKGRNRSGHLYFSIKDEKSSINAVMFKYDTFSLSHEIKNGDKVLVLGNITSYPPNGTYQIICKSILPFGEGNMLLQKEILKQKLAKEGLFDEEHKKALPEYPLNIAIITGKNSAAEHDFKFNINRRFPISKIKFYYAIVQGTDSAHDLLKSLENAIEDKPDVIIIGRGGGSIEDLDSFDDEELVRALYKCEIPTISAVGHEINLSLCDLVCDKHASTPTGACEYCVPDIEEVNDDVKQMKVYLDTLIISKINKYSSIVKEIKSKKIFINLNEVYNNLYIKIEKSKNIIESIYKDKISFLVNKLSGSKMSIELNNPENILKKGYSFVLDKEGKIIKSIKDVKKDDILAINVYDGIINVKVQKGE